MNEQFTKPIKVRPSRTSPQPPLIFENSIAAFSGSSDLGNSSALHHGQELKSGNHADNTVHMSPFKFHETSSAFQAYKSPRSSESTRRDEVYHPQFSGDSTFLSSNEDIRRTPGPSRMGSEDKDRFGPINAFQQGLPFASPLQRALDQFDTGAAESPNLMNIVDRILVGMQDEDHFFPASSGVSDNAIVKVPSSEQQFLIDVTESLGGTFSSDVDGLTGSDLTYKDKSYIPSSNYFGEDAFSIREFPIDLKEGGFSFGLDPKQSFRQRDQFSGLTAQLSNSWDSADSGYSLGYGQYQEHVAQEQQPHHYQDHTLRFNAQYSRQLPPPPPSLKPLQHTERQISAPSSFTAPPRSQSPILSYTGFNPPNHNYSSLSTAGSFQSTKATSSYEDFSGVTKSRQDAYENTSSSEINPKWASTEPERASTRKTGSSSSHEVSSSNDKKADSRKSKPLPNERHSQESAKAVPIVKPSFEPSETPLMKAASKKFSEALRLKERESLDAAKDYAMKALESMSEGLIWKVYEELADMAKRHDQFDMARDYYKKTCELQPSSHKDWHKNWLEWSKLEEECGSIEDSIAVLEQGLEACSFNEALLTKAMKQLERLNRVKEAREMLSVVKREPTDKNWKSMLEGALFEARTGRAVFARKCLKYLMHNTPWYGPIYWEAFRLEEKCENFEAAYRIIRQGLLVLPRYGPLWFGLLRLSERDDILEETRQWVCGVRPVLQRTRDEKQKGVALISRELVWKLHFEAGQAEERAADITAEARCRKTQISPERARDRLYSSARKSYAESLIACPQNLRWKVWLAGARLELAAGQLARTRKLLQQAFAETPEKSRAYVYLECARVEEFVGNISGARKLLEMARKDVRQEWKVFLESVLLEARDGDMLLAIHTAKLSLNLHTGTGRLWALLIQLCHREEYVPINRSTPFTLPEHPIALNGYEPDDATLDLFGSSPKSSSIVPSKIDILKKALNEVPKSGEVWCEGARVYMNPMAVDTFDLCAAQRNLNFAIQFTPQYGDTFIEILRLEILCQLFLPKVLVIMGISFRQFVNNFLDEDPESDISTVANTDEFRSYKVDSSCRVRDMIALENFQNVIGISLGDFERLSIEKLVQRCLNADPNYGTLWFSCKLRSYDTAGSVTKGALVMLSQEMIASHTIYMRAIFRYVSKCMICGTRPVHKEDFDGMVVDNFLKDFKMVEDHFGSMFYDRRTTLIPVVNIVSGTYTSRDFVTAAINLNRTVFQKDLPADDKRKNLFGADQIIP